jgi:cytoskeletal protein CcmA (bactofilin family)
MASTFENDLRLEEIGTGEKSGTWGVTTNTNLELIGDAFGYSAKTLASAATDTLTVPDGTSTNAEARALYIRYSGGNQNCTVTIGPNTLSKLWFIHNGTSHTITFSQGSGANVVVAAGKLKVIATDGGGSSAIVYDVTQNISVPDLFVDNTLTVAGNTDLAAVEFNSLSGTGSVAITDILDEDNMASNSATKLATQQSIKTYVDNQVATSDTLTEVLANGNTTATDQKIQFRDNAIYINSSADGQLDLVADTEIQIAATTIDINGAINASGEIIAASLDISGNIDVDGTTNLDVVDIDGAVDMATTLAVAGNVDFNGDLDVDGTTNLDVVDIDGAVDMATTLAVAGNVDFNGDLDVDGTTNLDVVDIDGAVDMATTLTVGSTITGTSLTLSGNIDLEGDIDVNGTANLDVVDIDGAVDMASTLTVAGTTDVGTLEFDSLSGTGSVAVTDILDEDNMSSNSATKLATQQSIKAYVDTQVATVPVGDITSVVAGAGMTGGGTSGAVTLDVVGGTGITANANDIAIDSTVATLSGTQTLTNKSIDAAQLTGTVANARLDAQLQDVAGLAVTNGNFIVGDGSNFVAESGSTARTSLGLGTAAVTDTGIGNGNVAVFTSGAADNDFLRIDGTSVEGRSASEVLSDIGGQATLTFGISNTNAVKIDSASVADDDYARFTANGVEGRSAAEVITDIGAATVDEATALAIALG